MKRLLTILLVLPFIANGADLVLYTSANPWYPDRQYVVGIREGQDHITYWTDHNICTGSGACNLTSMSTYAAGDRAVIAAGTYSSMDFENLDSITIVNALGLVVCAGTMEIGRLTAVTITGSGGGTGAYYSGTMYGIEFTDTSATNIVGNGGFQSDKISYVFFHQKLTMGAAQIPGSNQQDCIDFNNNRDAWVYDGTAASLYSNNFVFDHIAMVNCGQAYAGTFSGPQAFTGTTRGNVFSNFKIDSAETNGDVFSSNAMFDMVAHDDTILNSGLQANGDRGVWDIVGNPTMYNICRKYGFGYLIRVQAHGLNSRTNDSHIYNCMDVGTSNYGTIDYRINPTDTSTNTTIPYVKGSSLYAEFITSGNKHEALGFTSAPAVIYNYAPVATYGVNGYVCSLRNFLVFNNVLESGKTNHVFAQETGDAPSDTAKLYYFANPVTSGLFVDTINFILAPSSPAIGLGVASSYVTVDHSGIPRDSVPDIGWAEHPSATAPQSIKIKIGYKPVTSS